MSNDILLEYSGDLIKALQSCKTMHNKSIPTFISYPNTCLVQRSSPEGSLILTPYLASTTACYSDLRNKETIMMCGASQIVIAHNRTDSPITTSNCNSNPL